MSELDMTNPEQFQQALAEAAELDAAGVIEDAALEEVAEDVAPQEAEEEVAPAEDDSIDDVVVTDKGKMVPYGRVKDMAAKLQAANERALVGETQLRTILDAMTAKEERERAPQQLQQTQRPKLMAENPYDKDTQPVEHLEYKAMLQDEKIAELTQRYENDRQQQSTMTQAQQMLAGAGAELNAAEASGTIPDANDRAKYLIDAKAAEISLFARNREEFTQALDNYKLALIGAAKKQNKSIAEVTKVLSDSMGYAPKAKAAPAAQRNISAIASNRAKSASVGSGAPTQLNGAGNSIESVMNKNGRGVNPDEFHKMMKNLSL